MRRYPLPSPFYAISALESVDEGVKMLAKQIFFPLSGGVFSSTEKVTEIWFIKFITKHFVFADAIINYIFYMLNIEFQRSSTWLNRGTSFRATQRNSIKTIGNEKKGSDTHHETKINMK